MLKLIADFCDQVQIIWIRKNIPDELWIRIIVLHSEPRLSAPYPYLLFYHPSIGTKISQKKKSYYLSLRFFFVNF